MREFAKPKKNMAKIKETISNDLALITWQKKRKLWTHTFFLPRFSPPHALGECCGKFISAKALRSRRLCMAVRSLAAGVFAGKNDPKGIDGVLDVDGRPIGKNTNN